LETLVVAVERSEHRRPWLLDDQLAAGSLLHFAAALVDHFGLDTEERQRRRTGLGRRDARQRTDHDAARLRLPPGVDDRTAVFADNAVVPHPGFRVDRLADGAEETERAEVVFLNKMIACPHERADGGRGGVED